MLLKNEVARNAGRKDFHVGITLNKTISMSSSEVMHHEKTKAKEEHSTSRLGNTGTTIGITTELRETRVCISDLVGEFHCPMLKK